MTEKRKINRYRITQSDVIWLHKNKTFDVISFDKDTKRRLSTYGSLNPTLALDEAMRKLSFGYLVLVLESDTYPNYFSIERNERKRVHHDVLKGYQKQLF